MWRTTDPTWPRPHIQLETTIMNSFFRQLVCFKILKVILPINHDPLNHWLLVVRTRPTMNPWQQHLGWKKFVAGSWSQLHWPCSRPRLFRVSLGKAASRFINNMTHFLGLRLTRKYLLLLIEPGSWRQKFYHFNMRLFQPALLLFPLSCHYSLSPRF